MREFVKEFFIDYSLVDKNYTLKLSSLLRFMQNMATEHYELKGLGRERLISEGMVFLLSKIALKLEREIKATDTLEIKTFEKEVKGAYFVRDFEFFKENEKIGSAQTLWVIVNPETHAILRPADFPYEIETTDTEVEVSAGKISTRDLTEIYKETRKVRYSDLDCNGHMNNCVYADYTIDALAEILPEFSVNEFHINFNRECKMGDTLTLTVFDKEGKIVSGDFFDGKNSFTAKII